MNFRYAEDVDRTFKTALLFSAVLHMVMLFNWPFYRHLFTERRSPGDIEITYLKLKEQAPKASEVSVRRSQSQAEISQPEKLVTEDTPKAQPNKAEDVKKEQISPQANREPAKADSKETEQPSRVVIKEPITSNIEATASVDVQGLRLVPPSYSHIVRNRIIDNLEMMKSGVEGDVYVRFVISSDGRLKEMRIIDEKSSDSGFLRSAAFEAVKNAAPFPAFPAAVNVPEIAFTCEISFARR